MIKPIIFTDHNDSILNTYLKDISKFKIYSTNEILNLTLKAQKGDMHARDLVIKSNLRFVVTIAKRFQGRGVPLMDLISEGNRGLMHAIDLFDVDKGVPFISYSAFWIRQYILQSINWTGREIRIPVSQHNKIVQILKAKSDFTKINDREPSSIEIAEITGIDIKDIDFLSQYGSKPISVDDFLGGDSENNQVCDVIPDKEPLVDEIVNKNFMYTELEKILSKLTLREHDIICMLFGLGVHPMENQEIANMFGVGIERIRQLKEGALHKLRTRYGNQLLAILK